jgi:hypothetical protein
MSLTLIHKYGIHLVVLLGLGSSACAVHALSQESANELANLPIRQFLKVRFVDAVHQPLISAKGSEVRADGSVLLEAMYWDKTTTQLYRPSTELRRFCLAQQGKFEVERIDRSTEREERESQRRKADEERFCTEQEAAGTTSVAHCLSAMDRARSGEPTVTDPEPAAESEQHVAPDAFGRFSCIQVQQAKYPGWSVTIEAVAVRSEQSGNFNTNILTLLIAPQADSK